MAFKFYSCKVRLQGNVLNEVPKTDVTAPEIEILRALHGSDAVVNIVEAGEAKRSDRDERARLVEIYANPKKTVAESAERKMRMIRDLFGHDRNPLPKDLDLSPVEPEDEADDEVEAQPEIPVATGKRTRVEKPAFAD